MDIKQETNGIEEYLQSFVWRSNYSNIPLDVKDTIKKRLALTLYNYHEAKAHHYYLVKLRENGLTPSASAVASNGLRLWWWVTSATVISLGILIDNKNNTNSVIALQRKITHCSKSHPELKISNAPIISQRDDCVKEITKLRGNVFAHSNESFLDSITNEVFMLDDSMVNECLTKCFSILKTVCDHYFEGVIPEEISQDYDENFAARLAKLVTNEKV